MIFMFAYTIIFITLIILLLNWHNKLCYQTTREDLVDNDRNPWFNRYKNSENRGFSF